MGWKDWSYSLKGMIIGGVITGGITFIWTLFGFIISIIQKDYFMNSLSEHIAFYGIFGPIGLIGSVIPGLFIGALIGWIHGKIKSKKK